jgi:excinuclease ABC subunit B
MKRAIGDIQDELQIQLNAFEKQGKLLEAQRLRMRTTFDIEMMEQLGFCSVSRTILATLMIVALALPHTAF